MLIIDTNCLPAVFEPGDLKHPNYSPVLNFLTRRRGIVYIGGSKFGRELARMTKYLGIIKELEKIGRVKSYPLNLVDQEEARVKGLTPTACDDQHIIALVSISGARVVATEDRRSDQFLKDRALYAAGRKPPAIYRSARHFRLLAPLKTAT